MKTASRLLSWLIFAAASPALLAGPPFFTDDPVPLNLRNWEFYLASQHFVVGHDVSGTLPHVVVNYVAV